MTSSQKFHFLSLGKSHLSSMREGCGHWGRIRYWTIAIIPVALRVIAAAVAIIVAKIERRTIRA